MNALLIIASLLLASETAEPPAIFEPPKIIVVVGAAGAPEYAEPFAEWAGRWQAAAEKAGVGCIVLGTDTQTSTDEDSTERSDRQRLETLLEGLPKESPEPLWIVLIGHGTFDGRKAKFNMRGPDIAAVELAEWLEPFDRRIVVINCASSSGPFINELSGPNRVVVTATKSGYESNYARFGDYMSAAITDPTADLDKDDQTSLLEAFLSASGAVADFYEQEARLATETAIMDDNADGLGTPAEWFRGIRVTRRARQGASADGLRAHQIHLIPSDRERDMPVEVRNRRNELELAIAELRDTKGEGPEEEQRYYAQLEPLMLELARLYASLEDSQNSSEPANGPDTSLR